MPKLTPLKSDELIRKLKQLWYDWPEAWGRHSHMTKWPKIIPIPLHWGKEIWVGLISKIIKEVDITRDEWIDL